MLLLSICIPYYNQIYTLRENLSMIFQSASDEFEVVVVDNCSTRDAREELAGIRDPRLRIIRRENAVSGPQNVSSCPLFANGKYSLLCLDKNYIRGEEIDRFIQTLKNHSDIYGGYCEFYLYEKDALQYSKRNFKIYRKWPLIKFCYRSGHPTGVFYLTRLIKKIYPTILDNERESAFNYDFLTAECAARGPMMVYDYPLWISYKGIEGEKHKSYSFSVRNKNLYILPEERMKCFFEFWTHLRRLPCSKIVRMAVLLRLYRAALLQVTIKYRSAITDVDISSHYHIAASKEVPNKELRHYWNQFNHRFLESDMISFKPSRYLLCVMANIIFILSKGKHLL